MVVDDEHADRHGTGTSATSVVPAPDDDSIRSRPPTSPTRSRMPASPRASSRVPARVEARAVVLDHGDDGPVLAGEQDADVARAGVLDDVRQRLLDDAVEGGLDFAREPLLAELRLQVDPEPRLLAERGGEPLDRRHEAEVVERGRAQLDRERAHVLQRRDDELAHGRDRGARLVAPDRLLERLQPEQDRGERLAGLVVELAGEPAPLELLGLDDTPHRVAADALREVDGDRGSRRERLRESKVVVAERGRRPLLVVGDQHPDPPPAHDERDIQARMDAEPARRRLVDLGVLEHGVDALAPRPFEDASRLGGRELEPHAGDAVAPVTLGRSDPQCVPLRQRDQDEPGADELPQAPGDEREQRLELELRGEREPDLVQRLELPQPARRALVEPGVLDRHRGLRREQLRQLLVLLAEVLAARLLGQVEVAVGDAAEQDRDAEEAAHRRVVAREADRARVVGDVVQAERARLADQHAEDAAPARQVADRRVRLLVDARS